MTRLGAGQPLSIDFTLHGAGWGDLRFAGDTGFLIQGVSYLSDPLGDMIAAAIQLAIGSTPRPVYFALEPAGYRLEFGWVYEAIPFESQSDDGAVTRRRRRVAIYDCGDFFGAKETGGNCEWAMEHDDPDFFSRAVLDLAGTIMERYGAAGFRSRWDPEYVAFPTRGVAALAAALSVCDDPVEW